MAVFIFIFGMFHFIIIFEFPIFHQMFTSDFFSFDKHLLMSPSPSRLDTMGTEVLPAVCLEITGGAIPAKHESASGHMLTLPGGAGLSQTSHLSESRKKSSKSK